MSKKRTNIIKFSKHIDINVGFIILAVVCIYILVSVFIYIASKKTVIYEVNSGSLALDNIYNAFIVRDEELVKSDYSGTLNYYVNPADKAGSSTIVYSVDEAGRVSSAINELYSTQMTDDDLKEVADSLSKYTLHYDSDQFDSLYELHGNISDSLTSLHSTLALEDIDRIVKDTDSENLFHSITVKEPGIVMNSYDSYTDFTETMLSDALFDTSSYEKTTLENDELINSGDVAYRLVHSDDFYLYIELSETDAAKLSADSSVSLRFIDSDISCKAGFDILTVGDRYYGKITLHKFMINFIDERYVKIELVQESITGLKIPTTAVFNKNFYTIPKEYRTESGMFIHMYYNTSGEQITETVTPTIYDEDEEYYYVSMNDFASGDILLKEGESGDQFLVGTIGERTGVYCVNKGYAVFKIVNILDENDEYDIVEPGTKYGLSVYDHIVLDYSSVKENEIIDK